jgi:hypothetical protein
MIIRSEDRDHAIPSGGLALTHISQNLVFVAELVNTRLFRCDRLPKGETNLVKMFVFQPVCLSVFGEWSE